MEVPNDGWLVQQCDPIDGRNTTEGRNTLRHQLLFVRIEGIRFLVEILAGNEGESQRPVPYPTSAPVEAAIGRPQQYPQLHFV